MPDGRVGGSGGVDARRRDDGARLRPRRAQNRDRDRARRPSVLLARRQHHEGRARPVRVPEAGRRRARAPRHAGEALRRAPRDGSPARVSSDLPVFQGGRKRPLRRGSGTAPQRRRRSRRASDRHQVRTWFAQLLQRYGERFEDSEGKRIFLEFADEERTHLDLLLNEYKALRERQGKRPRKERALRRTTSKSRH